MITKEQKKEKVAELVEKFKKANSYYFVDFTGMNVETTIQFRRDLKRDEMELKVAKNSLISRALSELGEGERLSIDIFGPTGIVFGYGDPIRPARLINERYEKEQRPVFKGAVVEGVVYEADKLKVLASLPSKTDIIASILGSLNAPVSGIVGAINSIMRDIASVIEEVAKKNSSN